MIPRPEHPKPQFQRESWQNLNGEWEFAFDHGVSGLARGLHLPETAYPQRILVPFCPESERSGIGYKDFMACVWYRRSLKIEETQLEGQVLLHFGAADYETHVFINGEEAGVHRGGYASFSMEIGPWLHAGENSLTVQCIDDLRGGQQPRGKQCAQFYSKGCDYTRTTGIWQTVWLEFVPKTYLQGMKAVADMYGRVSLQIQAKGEERLRLRAQLSLRGELASEAITPAQTGCNQLLLQVPEEKLRLWDVGQPNLYDLELCLEDSQGRVTDRVKSYLGLRSVELKQGAIWLNGRPLFQRLVLDQGFYPDGVYTAPSDAALKGDIELSMGLGFNGARLHQKIFEERFLYWADRLGYLVWGEHASWGLDHSKPEALYHFLPEWLEAVEREYNHPSIVGWCPFNETWDVQGRQQDDEVLRSVYRATKAADPTRPVIDTSGNYHVETDVYDIHDYEQDVALYKARYGGLQEGEIYETFPKRQSYGGQPYFVSEFGGAWWAPGRSDGWGYGQAPKTEDEFAERFEGLTSALLDCPRVCAYCYTQLTNVEQEQNGLVAYDRSPKFSPAIYERIYRANTRKAAIEKRAEDQ